MTDMVTKEQMKDLSERVEQFHTLSLPGQPMMMHMGTSCLVSDLWKALQEAHAALTAMDQTND